MLARDRREAKLIQLTHQAQSASSSAFLDQILHAKAFWTFDLLSDFFDLVKDFFKVCRGPGRTEHRSELAAAGDSDPLALGGAFDDLRQLLLSLKEPYGAHGKPP
jgi:hypothetical protein